MPCPSCGREVRPGATVCDVCGANLNEPSAEVRLSPPDSDAISDFAESASQPGEAPAPDSNDTLTFTIKKIHLYVVLVLVLGFGGGLGAGKLLLNSSSVPGPLLEEGVSQQRQAFSATTPVTPQQPTIVEIDTVGRPFLGPEDAPITLVEFTDYECPFCGRHFRDTAPRILSQYDGRIKYVVLNFPLSTIHPGAQKAAEAAECAHDQGKFWEYHDMLFRNQAALDGASLNRYAADIGLDTVAFSTCLDSGAKRQQVLSDFQLGQSVGVSGTPMFFVNGQPLLGARPFSSFQRMIDAALGQ